MMRKQTKNSVGDLLYISLSIPTKTLYIYKVLQAGHLTYILYIVYSIHMACTYCSWGHNEYNNVRLFSARENDVTKKCSWLDMGEC